MVELAIHVTNLCKEYTQKKWLLRNSKTIVAIQNLNFTIDSGDSIAFLGRNGAGKSTTIKMLCGIIMPTRGSCLIYGSKAGSIRANRNIGIIFGTRSQLGMHLTIYQSLNIISEMYGITGKEKKYRIQELSDLIEIKELLHLRTRTLSLGQRMSCELAAAIIHNPKILFADEPTIGLDAIAKYKFRELMNRWHQEKKSTLILTSHDCFDVEKLCKRFMLINKGVLQYNGDLYGLKGDLRYIRRIAITTSKKYPNIVLNHKYIQLIHIQEYCYTFQANIKSISMVEVTSVIFKIFEDQIIDIKIQEVNLEEVIHNLFKK